MMVLSINSRRQKNTYYRGYTPLNDLNIIIRGSVIFSSSIDGIYCILLWVILLPNTFRMIGPLAYVVYLSLH